jgi:hypothetical protein
MEGTYKPPDLERLREYLLTGQFVRVRAALELGDCPWKADLADLVSSEEDVLWLLKNNFQVTPHAFLRCFLATRDSFFEHHDGLRLANDLTQRLDRIAAQQQKIIEHLETTTAAVIGFEAAMMATMRAYAALPFDDRPEQVRLFVNNLPSANLQKCADELSLYLTLACYPLENDKIPWKPDHFGRAEDEEEDKGDWEF